MLAYIKASNGETFDQFGYSVALSGDGATLAVGAPLEDGPSNTITQAGAVYIFTRSGDVWSEQATLHPTNADAGDQLGLAVALSFDGNTLAAAAPAEDSSATTINGNAADNAALESGAVYIFVRTGSSWSQQAYIKARNAEAQDFFGAAVALSASGDVLAVGADQEDSPDTGINGAGLNGALDAGAAYTFTRSGTTWTPDAYIKASNTEAGDGFGFALALTADGTRLVVGAPTEDSSATTINGDQTSNTIPSGGAAYVFVHVTAWSQEAYIKPTTIDFGDFFGRTIALAADGLTLAGASPGNDSAVANSGAVFTFVRTGATWSNLAELKAFMPGDNDQFGAALAISASGGELIVGAPQEDSDAMGVGGAQDNDNSINSGAAYTFSRAPGVASWVPGFYAKGAHPSMGDEYANGLAVSADGRTIAFAAHFEDSAATTINGDATDNSATDSGCVEVSYFGQ